jgi:hypothetical protein
MGHTSLDEKPSEVVGYYEGAAGDGPRSWAATEITARFLLVKRADGSKDRYLIMEYDAEKKAFSLSDRFSGAPATNFTLQVERAGEEVILSGALREEQIHARLRKVEVTPMPLMSRGFRWVNEFPFNR